MFVATDRERHLITMNSNNYKDVCVHLFDIKYFESTGLLAFYREALSIYTHTHSPYTFYNLQAEFRCGGLGAAGVVWIQLKLGLPFA